MTTRALELTDMSVRLDGRAVVEGLTLTLPAGALVAIVGPNGAGKTSLLRALVGLLPFGGTATLDGVPLSGLGTAARARLIAYLPQGHEAHWPLPVHDIVALGRLPHGASDPARLSATDGEAVAEALRVTDTVHLSARSVTSLSGGERARVALARVFAVQAPVILADEPTAALDPRHQIDVMQALRRSAQAGALVIAVTHDLGLAARFADAVVVMEAGRVVAAAPPGEALAPDIVARVFGVAILTLEHQGRPVVVPWS